MSPAPISRDPAITVTKVSKSFKLPHERINSLKTAIVNVYRRKRSYEVQKTLHDVSFEVERGEFFGIVGRNGSGKSTLLKLLAGIYLPNKGSVQVHGTLVPFIELGVGFNPELTGRENVYLNGALLGFSRNEVSAIYDDIVEFAELNRFMDQKLKNYSSGMQVRLAFSIAIQARQDILLVDEVLAVGDTRFQNKCYKTFRQLKEEGRTIVFVTHDMAAVERFCDRTLVLDKGIIRGIYEPREAAVIYEEMNATDTDKQGEDGKPRRWGTEDVVMKSLTINGRHTNKAVLGQGKSLSLLFSFKNKSGPKPIVLGLAFYDAFGTNMSGPNSLGVQLNSGESVTFTVPQLSFNPGEYTVQAVIFDENAEKEYDYQEVAATLTITARDHQQLHGKVNVFGTWQQ